MEFIRRHNIRYESIKNAISSKSLEQNKKEILKSNIKTLDSFYYFSRFSCVIIIGFLNKKKYFDIHSTYFKKELVCISGLLLYNFSFDRLVSEYTWSKCQHIIREYALKKEENYLMFKRPKTQIANSLIYNN